MVVLKRLAWLPASAALVGAFACDGDSAEDPRTTATIAPARTIERLSPTATPVPITIPGPIVSEGWRRLYSPEGAYAIDYPQDWSVLVAQNVDNFLTPDRGTTVSVDYSGGLGGEVDLAREEEAQISAIRQNSSAEPEVVGRGPINGYEGFVLRYTTPEGRGMRQVTFYRDPTMWVVTLATELMATPEEEQLMDHMVDSMEFDG
jgi:hypothetical protein